MGWLFGSRDAAPAEERAITNLPWVSDTGGALSGRSLESALALVPVYGAVRLISEALSGLPIKTYRRVNEDDRLRIRNPDFLSGPPGETTPVWLQKGLVSALLRGNAYGLKSGFGVAGVPSAVRWLHPDRVTYDEVKDQFYYDGRVIQPDELVHIPAMSLPGKRLGITPIAACAAMVQAGVAIQDTTRDTYRNKAVPSLKMRNTAKVLKAREAERAKARLKAHLRAGEPLVLGSDWDVTAIGPTAEDAAFITSLKASATQVATMFGIPPEEIGGEVGGTSLTYSTTEANEIRFNTRALAPWATRFEAAFSALLPSPQYVKFNLDARLKVDTKTRWDVHKVARELGARSVDEIRRIEDEPPLPNGQGEDYAPLKTTPAAPPTPQEAP